MNTHKIFLTTSIILFSILACKKDELNPISNPPNQNEEELITTMKLTFVDSAGALSDQTFYFQDIDGPGGNAPSQFDTIRIQPNRTYLVTIELLNESLSPASNISDEVLEEAGDHLFCFDPLINNNLTIVRTDSDGTYEVGLSSKWTTFASSSGMIKIRLKHQPGIKNGSCDVGETDIELDFQLEIE